MKLRSPAVLMAIGVAATFILALVVVMALLRTGGAKALSDNAALIGALVALGGVFTAQMVSIALEDRRAQDTRALEDQREEQARELEAQRAHEAALQNYFEDVGKLLIEKPLLRASPGDTLSTVVRAQTLAVLEGLDPDRKRILLMFLYESGLIYKRKPVVSLAGVNLTVANLRLADLSGADLSEADLSEANLSEAHLERVHLEGANLEGANLEGARLGGANLQGARLVDARLEGAVMDDSMLVGKMQVKGPAVHLENAILSGADLRGATLFNAHVENTNFVNANLEGTHLEGTDLRRAKGLTQEQVNVAIGDPSTTLPNGLRVPPEWEKKPESESFE